MAWELLADHRHLELQLHMPIELVEKPRARVGCQNHDISKSPPETENPTYIPPEKLVSMAKQWGCQSISFSFNEPTLQTEYALDVMKLAGEEGLTTNYVTNGYMSEEALSALIDEGLDAMSVDVKGCEEAVKRYCGADVEVVWRNIEKAYSRGVHVEVVNLVIPGVSDQDWCFKEIAQKLLKACGDQATLHFTRYYPAYKFSAPPTPVKTLERARELAMEQGLKYVYVGNVPGHPYENTYCHSCGEEVVRRYVFDVVGWGLDPQNRCKRCGEKIPIRGSRVYAKPRWRP